MFLTQHVTSAASPFKEREKPLVGAIRWDGWVGDLNRAGLEVERILSPNQYHYRAPFFSTIVNDDSIQCRGTTQAIMDQEIAYAKYAGLDYWAFCWYPPHSGLDTARQLYLTSKHRDDINWCVILGTNPFDYNKDGKWLVERFKESNYQKVLNGRPLVYIFSATATLLSQLIELRNLSRLAGVPDPYIVVMEFSIRNAVAAADSLHADAISCYASVSDFETGAPYKGAAYSPAVSKSDQAGWEKYVASGKKLVPWVTTGWNPKPRIERSVLWNSYYTSDGYAKDGTPDQIAQGLQNAINWSRSNANAAEANVILMYAWNEFDEGGWICPTLGNNTSRLDAIRKILK
ncbi:MAG: glycoside hydrolase family 99-like domain-containing protein [Chitinophagaceae bacterium]|nr:glycoside hydrolase family 99-like domain-containing protein [Chitinophagaceae bacterium]